MSLNNQDHNTTIVSRSTCHTNDVFEYHLSNTVSSHSWRKRIEPIHDNLIPQTDRNQWQNSCYLCLCSWLAICFCISRTCICTQKNPLFLIAAFLSLLFTGLPDQSLAYCLMSWMYKVRGRATINHVAFALKLIWRAKCTENAILWPVFCSVHYKLYSVDVTVRCLRIGRMNYGLHVC